THRKAGLSSASATTCGRLVKIPVFTVAVGYFPPLPVRQPHVPVRVRTVPGDAVNHLFDIEDMDTVTVRNPVNSKGGAFHPENMFYQHPVLTGGADPGVDLGGYDARTLKKSVVVNAGATALRLYID